MSDKKIKRKVIEFLLNFSFIWSIWYNFWVNVTKPSNGQYKLTKYSAIEEIVKVMDFGRDYAKDPLNGLLDIMYHPRRIQKRINNSEKIGDCDDYAIYWATSLLKSNLAVKAWIGTVYYIKNDGKFSGHTVCIFQDLFGRLFWVDYEEPHLVSSHEEWARQIGQEKYGISLLSSVIIPIKFVDIDFTPHFGPSYKVV